MATQFALQWYRGDDDMEKTTTLNLRVNPVIKQNAEAVLKQLGIPMATAVDMFLRQISLTGSIPFSLFVAESACFDQRRRNDLAGASPRLASRLSGHAGRSRTRCHHSVRCFSWESQMKTYALKITDTALADMNAIYDYIAEQPIKPWYSHGSVWQNCFYYWNISELSRAMCLAARSISRLWRNATVARQQLYCCFCGWWRRL